MRAEPCTALDRAPVRRAAACFIVAVGAIAAIAPGAAAHGREKLPDSAAAEQRLRAYETATLGAAHAAEHARARALEPEARRRWLRLTPSQRLRVEARERAEQTALEQAAGPPAQVGAWTTAPFRLPNFASTRSYFPTGKVLLFSSPSKSAGPPLPNRGWRPCGIRSSAPGLRPSTMSRRRWSMSTGTAYPAPRRSNARVTPSCRTEPWWSPAAS